MQKNIWLVFVIAGMLFSYPIADTQATTSVKVGINIGQTSRVHHRRTHLHARPRYKVVNKRHHVRHHVVKVRNHDRGIR
ncbi:MAG: hypothetical protein FDX18_00485 [Chlorobium sp.]|nr:MAG: hypothetical protein FDX18_00485 [Chlorobium sp.]